MNVCEGFFGIIHVTIESEQLERDNFVSVFCLWSSGIDYLF